MQHRDELRTFKETICTEAYSIIYGIARQIITGPWVK